MVALPFVADAAPKGSSGPWGDDLVAFDTSRWQKADGWANGDPFNVGWRADHVTFANGAMTLRLDDQGCPTGCSGEPYASGEYRTLDTYGYGRYEVRMKAAAGSGLVSSFFTFNGPSERPRRPWDEIDIEILGRNTWQMQTNYFASGAGGHEAIVNLGFDAAADFHTYAFDWSSGRIDWFVDGVLMHTENGSRGPLPTTPGKVMMNLWTGTGVDGWLGSFSYSGPVSAQYDRVGFTPAGSAPPVGSPVHVRSLDLTVARVGGRYQGVASVLIADANGAPVPNVTVSGAWSGVTTTGNTSVKTDAAGSAVFYSTRTSSTGPYSFCVTGATASGWTYDPAANVATCRTATYP